MAYKLKKGVFRIKCTYPNCNFDHEVSIKQNIMGLTEVDVESEAKKIARDIAKIKHDALYGRKHQLTKPNIRKCSGVYEAIGAKKSSMSHQNEATKYVEYKKGDVILKKGDIASTICEIIQGSAYPDVNTSHVYNVGDSFGAAALLVNQSRTANVIAADDNTRVAFYNLKELSKKDPRKAKELYTEAMEDVFDVLSEMEELITRLDEELEHEKLASQNRKERIDTLEKELLEASEKIKELEG
jgi:CRP-like cAMP-binding protein